MAGFLTIKPISAKLRHDTETFGKMDPYCKITVGNNTQKTRVHKDAGKFPAWHDSLTFRRNSEALIHISVWDEDTVNDDLIGEVTIALQNILTKGKETEWHTLSYKGRNAGDILVEMIWKPNTVQQTFVPVQPSMMMPTGGNVQPFTPIHGLSYVLPQTFMAPQQPVFQQQPAFQQPVYQQPMMQGFPQQQPGFIPQQQSGFIPQQQQQFVQQPGFVPQQQQSGFVQQSGFPQQQQGGFVQQQQPNFNQQQQNYGQQQGGFNQQQPGYGQQQQGSFNQQQGGFNQQQGGLNQQQGGFNQQQQGNFNQQQQPNNFNQQQQQGYGGQQQNYGQGQGQGQLQMQGQTQGNYQGQQQNMPSNQNNQNYYAPPANGY